MVSDCAAILPTLVAAGTRPPSVKTMRLRPPPRRRNHAACSSSDPRVSAAQDGRIIPLLARPRFQRGRGTTYAVRSHSFAPRCGPRSLDHYHTASARALGGHRGIWRNCSPSGCSRRPSRRGTKQAYLAVTYRHGRLLAACSCLPRRGRVKAFRTRRVEAGLIVVASPCLPSRNGSLSPPSNWATRPVNA